MEARKLKRDCAENTSLHLTLTQTQVLENTGPTETTAAMEFASNTSFNPSQQTLVPPNTHLWNADTGATSHMTPHYHWLRDYSPYCVPIHLTDNTIVHSKGVGSAVFNTVISGRVLRPVEFTQVLHVPDLQNNLLAVLYLS